MKVLLDTNLLVALVWPNHQHHAPASKWFAANAKAGWATCALTQSAFVRLSLQPAIVGSTATVAEVRALLSGLTGHRKHAVVPMDFGFEEVLQVCTGGLWGHRQVTDAWLLCAAVRNRLKLVTFDRGVASLLATDEARARHLAVLRDAA